jgi:hypothetical protein
MCPKISARLRSVVFTKLIQLHGLRAFKSFSCSASFTACLPAAGTSTQGCLIDPDIHRGARHAQQDQDDSLKKGNPPRVCVGQAEHRAANELLHSEHPSFLYGDREAAARLHNCNSLHRAFVSRALHTPTVTVIIVGIECVLYGMYSL